MLDDHASDTVQDQVFAHQRRTLLASAPEKERDEEEWAEFWAWKRKQFWAERERAEHKTEVTEDGVIQGPWGEAS